MKIVPPTLFGKFKAAKKLSAEAGFKIFRPSRLYFNATHQFIAVSSDTKRTGVFRLWIEKGKLWIEFLPFYEHRKHQALLEKELRITIQQRHYNHHPALSRFDPIHEMVTPSQQREFKSLNFDIRLP